MTTTATTFDDDAKRGYWCSKHRMRAWGNLADSSCPACRREEIDLSYRTLLAATRSLVESESLSGSAIALLEEHLLTGEQLLRPVQHPRVRGPEWVVRESGSAREDRFPSETAALAHIRARYEALRLRLPELELRRDDRPIATFLGDVVPRRQDGEPTVH